MKKDSAVISSRRDLIKAVGGTAVILPLVGLGACSGGSDDAAPAAAKKPESSSDTKPAGSMAESGTMESGEATSEPAAEAASTSTSPDGAPARLSEDDPQARSLSYVHDASTIDSAAQPRYQEGQVCSNCALYQGKEGDAWGGCSIFPGRQVKATGWCSVYAPKAG